MKTKKRVYLTDILRYATFLQMACYRYGESDIADAQAIDALESSGKLVAELVREFVKQEKA